LFIFTLVTFPTNYQKKYHKILSEWKKQATEDKNNPNISVSDLIDRSDIPQDPELEPHLKKLTEMGFC
ncbi:MAG TPA: hypothetical protein VJA22_01795, partial [Patescibacteria group bacterium]|nr:hypothetical protein [Patescibacteria group bacterium]